MKKQILIFLLTLILVNCSSHLIPTTNIHTSVQNSSSLFMNQDVPYVSKIKNVNWLVSLTSLTHKMLLLHSIKNGDKLLINVFKNNTNGSVQIQKITNILINLVKNYNDKFKVIETKELNQARQIFKISVNDNFESRAKSIGLARYLKVKYILYGIIKGDIQQPTIELQLLSVHTGEIIWCGKTSI